MSGGGGSETVMSGPSAGASYLAGDYQRAASQAASAAAEQQTQAAISALRDQYSQGVANLKPYTTTGINALNELNQYLGLGAYNPGTAPTAPVAPTLDALKSKITDDQIKSYIMNNTTTIGGSNNLGVSYMGAGSFNNNPNAPGYVYWPGGAGGPQGPPSLMMLQNDILKQNGMVDAIKGQLASDALQPAQSDYNSQLGVYNQNKDVYDFAKNQYDRYASQGPLTPEEVNAKLANTPGYQFNLNQGVDAIQRASSAKGVLGSGRMLQALADYGQNLATTTYGSQLDRLSALAGAGQQGATTTTAAGSNAGSNLASLYSSLGDTQGNALLAGGQGIAQSILSANPTYTKIGMGGGSGLGGLGSLMGGAAGLLGSSATGGTGLMGLFAGAA